MSRFLLDSHVLLWWADTPHRLSTECRLALADGRHSVFVSVATVWELGLKATVGKLRLPGDLRDVIRDNRFDLLTITGDHAVQAVALPPLHRDPFDRMLVAQAQSEQLTLITQDRALARYNVALLAA